MAKGLPFGWAPAPGIFTKFIRQVLNLLRHPKMAGHHGLLIRQIYDQIGDFFVTAFLDDLLALANSYENAKLLCDAILQLFKVLALLFHPNKCQLRPVQELDHLGFKLDIPGKKFLLTEKQK